ncbi:MAG: hypothetical protein H0T89_07175 [Deltaproteobacteria bacterium]|nr:hypothetical protein [Deltaproteobacteria bacterium]
MIWTIVGTIAIVLGAIGIGVVVDRKWHILPRKDRLQAASRPRLAAAVKAAIHAAGEAPGTARAARASELPTLRARRCATCHAPTEPQPDDHVMYDGRELLVLHDRCTRCDHVRATYVDVR